MAVYAPMVVAVAVGSRPAIGLDCSDNEGEFMNPIELGIFSSRIESVCEEMGAMLRRAAFSPNIKDRLDFSCAVFDRDGGLSAQAAHIPVHLGSMAYAMADIVAGIDWQPGDMVVLNDPYKGGTHLPDITVVAPVFAADQLLAFVANRAHHANVGGSTPGSMPISNHLEDEGIVISPTHIVTEGELVSAVVEKLSQGNMQARGDFAAQISANRAGVIRLQALIEQFGVANYQGYLDGLNEYGRKLAASSLQAIPAGVYQYEDYLDDDGQGNQRIKIKVAIHVSSEQKVRVDFTGTDPQVAGNINCPISVAAAAVYYVFRCLMPDQTPACAGTFSVIDVVAPQGCLLNANYPAAVAAGNVETSTRAVDVVLGALAQAIPERVPAASHGSMNNVAMGADASGQQPRWDYYETIGGGMGASRSHHGTSAVQTHMTNTLNTPIESLELHYPLRVTQYAVRRGSGGSGEQRGGDGIVRELTFLAPAQVTLLTERRTLAPWGIGNGQPGERGANYLNDQPLAGKVQLRANSNDRLRIETPGGGGYSS